jgi:hypothetical protein
VELPGLQLSAPSSSRQETTDAWSQVVAGLRSSDFGASDKALARLGKSSEPAIRDTARLARALLWRANGRTAEVQPVVADLAENAKTPAIKKRAGDALGSW